MSASAAAPGRRAARPRLRLTRTGRRGIFLVLAVAAAAANTANNLLYLLLGLMIVAYPVSAWLARRAVARASGEIAAPADVRAGHPAMIVTTLLGGARGVSGVVMELRGSDASGAPAFTPKGGHVPHVAIGSSSSLSLSPALKRRGPAQLELVVHSPLPFGLMEGTRSVGACELLVLPDPDPLWRRAVPPSADEGAEAPRKGTGDDILNIRDYQWGEDARHVDWKATARLGRPMLREHAQPARRAAVLVVHAGGTPLAAGQAPDDQAERAIARAAGAAEDLQADGYALRLIAPGVDVSGDARTILRALARLPGTRAEASDALVARAGPAHAVVEFLSAVGPSASVRVRAGAA